MSSRRALAFIEERFGKIEEAPIEWQAFVEMAGEIFPDDEEVQQRVAPPVGLAFRLATDGTILDCQAADAGDLSRPRDELIGRNVKRCPFGTVGLQFEAAIDALRNGEASVVVDYVLPCDNGLVDFEARLVRSGDEFVVTVGDTTRHQDRFRALERRNVELEQWVERAETPILIVDAESGKILRANAFAHHCYLNEGEALVGQPFASLFIAREDMPSLRGLLASGAKRWRAPHRLGGGQTADVEMRFQAVTLEGRAALLCVHKKIAKADEDVSRIRRELALMEAAFEATADGILVIDRQRRIVTHNHLFQEMWRLEDHHLEPGAEQESTQFAASQLKEPDQFISMLDEVQTASVERSSAVLEFLDGRFFECVSMPRIVEGRVEGRVWSFRDITDRLQSEERVRYHAFHDVLTSLPNRTLFQDRLQQAIAQSRRSQSQVALLLIDLDRFKTINDTLGHDAGDQLLVEVSKRLMSRRREGDTIARLGGDEFVFLITQLRSREDVIVVAEQVLDVLKPSIVIDEHDLHVSASIGIAICPDDGGDGAALMKSADVALYRAKELGRNNYQIYEPKLSQRAMERMVMEKDLRRAINNREFIVQYQPQFDLSSGSMTGFEALVRWQRGGKMVPPDRFIPIAEECGLVVPLGRWVLREAAAMCTRVNAINESALRVCVNLSALQIQRPNFANEVSLIAHEAGLPLTQLCLELTESALMNHPELGSWAMSQLQEMGVGLALDDFGTGHSSLSNVSHLPISMIKIDKAFVKDCATRKTDEAIIAAIITMGHALRLKVLAEGVEDVEQVRVLQRHGCDEIQGYLYGRPMSGDDLIARLREGGDRVLIDELAEASA